MLNNNGDNDYTIMEWNKETLKYTVIGFAFGCTPSEAKENFVNENKWKPRNTDTFLFAKPPVCR